MYSATLMNIYIDSHPYTEFSLPGDLMDNTSRQSLESARGRLLEEFAGVFARETIDRCVDDSYAQLPPAKVRTHLPLLAERFARERLRAAARAVAPAPGRAPLVLFVCTANSGRSQMAAALLQRSSRGAVEVASAGNHPAQHVQPEVTTVLAELEIGTAEMFPKPLTDEVVSGADVVVTMGCGDTCTVIPGRRYLDWDVADPAGADLDTVRDIRDEIADHVAELLSELDISAEVSAR